MTKHKVTISPASENPTESDLAIVKSLQACVDEYFEYMDLPWYKKLFRRKP